MFVFLKRNTLMYFSQILILFLHVQWFCPLCIPKQHICLCYNKISQRTPQMCELRQFINMISEKKREHKIKGIMLNDSDTPDHSLVA